MKNALSNSEKLTNSKADKIYMFSVLEKDNSFLLNNCVTQRTVACTRMALLFSTASITLSNLKYPVIQAIIVLILIIGGISFIREFVKYNKDISRIKSDIIRDKKRYMQEML